MKPTHEPNIEFLYVYCLVAGLVNDRFSRIGIGGRGDEVFGWPFKDLTAIVSRTDRCAFERSEENVLAHQRVVQRIFSRYVAVPLPFSTIVESDEELESLLGARYDEFRKKLEKLEEIIQPIDPEPGQELVEEALAQSLASALRIRQLNEELSKLAAVPTVGRQENTLLDFESKDSGLGRERRVIHLNKSERARGTRKKQKRLVRIVHVAKKRSIDGRQYSKKTFTRVHGLLDPTRLPTCAGLFPRFFQVPRKQES